MTERIGVPQGIRRARSPTHRLAAGHLRCGRQPRYNPQARASTSAMPQQLCKKTSSARIHLQVIGPPGRSFMVIRTSLLLALCVSLSIAVAEPPTATSARTESSPSAAGQGDARHPATGIPTWAQGARWYHVVVPVFHNGDPTNDPPGTAAWSTGWTSTSESSSPRTFGGDLLGLTKRLPYLKELGVDTLHLSGIFGTRDAGGSRVVDLRHVDDSLGVKGSIAKLAGETLDPTTWKLSASDRIFLDFLKVAHNGGFHVVLDVDYEKDMANDLTVATKRWMDPDGNKDPSDGVDGWVIQNPQKAPHGLWKKWRKQVKATNRNALLVCDLDGEPESWVTGDEFDVAVDRRLAREVMRFFAAPKKAGALQGLANALSDIAESTRPAQVLATPRPFNASELGRLFTTLKLVGSSATQQGAPSTEKLEADAVARWRLAASVLSSFPGAPLIRYGDEVGMHGEAGSSVNGPMWWNDLPDAKTKPPAWRDDFAALIQWVNIRRDLDAPLDSGTFRLEFADTERSLFAFARVLPDDEAIMIVNFGSTKQVVTMEAGRPGQIVGVLSPRLGDVGPPLVRRGKATAPKSTYIQPQRLGGSRQIVTPNGEIRVPIEAMSMRLVLVRKETR